MSNAQDMCPICTEPFKKNEVLVRYITWEKDQHAEKLGHLDCVLHLSKTEERKHPPTLDDCIAELKKSHTRTVEQLATRITKLGG